MFLMMFVWIFVIVGLFFIFSNPFRGENYAFEKRPASSAVEILKQRYARGEINRAEFDAKKRDLAG
jgi:putative membrane protein